MLNQGIVFVLGAGFSAEVGLPVGRGLKKKIGQLLPDGQGLGDDYVRAAVFSEGDVENAARACEHIKKALPLSASIDNLVHHLIEDPQFVRCAKIGIASAVLRSEWDSALSIVNAASFTPPSETAYGDMFRLLVGGVPVAHLELAFSRLKIVNFNYDRSLENFFKDALISHSGVSPAYAEQIVSQATILRPYGSVGTSPWTPPYGAHISTVNLQESADNIKTYSEEIGSLQHANLKDLVGGASRLVFLGCAYHIQNLQIIQPNSNVLKHVDGTMYSPAPLDEHKNSAPMMAEFVGPSVEALMRRIRKWPRAAGTVGLTERNFRVEALTNRQLIARYGEDWLAS